MSDLVFVALGSNLGDRAAHLDFALQQLRRLPGTRVLAESDVAETAPLGGLPQPAYLNQMIAIETTLSPDALLDSVEQIEAARGRQRTTRWASRTLDLDIVDYGGRHVTSPRLTLPHPGLADRDFWQRQLSALRAVLAARR